MYSPRLGDLRIQLRRTATEDPGYDLTRGVEVRSGGVCRWVRDGIITELLNQDNTPGVMSHHYKHKRVDSFGVMQWMRQRQPKCQGDDTGYTRCEDKRRKKRKGRKESCP